MSSVTVRIAFLHTLYEWDDLVLFVDNAWRLVETIQQEADGQYTLFYKDWGVSHQLRVQPDFLLDLDDEQDEIYE